MSHHFYFDTCDVVFGVEIDQTERFVIFCVCLFFVGVVSEFISFARLCFSRAVVSQRRSVRSKPDADGKTIEKAPELVSLPSSSPATVYNSFEMMSKSSSSSSASSTKSLVSLTESDEAAAASSSSSQPSGHFFSFDTHFDLVKFHPAELAFNLELVERFGRIERSGYTKFDFFMENSLKLAEICTGYALMLIIMTFNFWFLLSLVLGYTFGYFIVYSDLFNLNFFLISKIILIYDKIKKFR